MMKLVKSLALGAAMAFAMGVAPAMAAKDMVTVGLQLEPPHLDPTSAAAGAIDQVVYSNVFEGLTRFAADGSVIPGLAKSWEISDDGLTYTFMLHDGVTFHDGTTMDAEDVKFSLDRARGEKSANAQKPLYVGISAIDVVDPLTVKITLAKPNGAFLFNLAWGDAVIVAPESIEDIKTAPVGTGAFTFDRWLQGDSITLARNENYWGKPAALSGATFKFISDPSAAFAALMAEDIDVFANFPAPENLGQFEADPRFQVLVGQTEGETLLAINNKQPPFDNLKVRQALAYAIDPQSIIDGAMYGLGTPIGSHFAPHHPAYVDLTSNVSHDPQKAKALLAEAGYENGFTARLMLPPTAYARRGGEIIAAQLREVGVETEITNVEWAQWLEQAFRGKDYDLTIISHTEPLDIGIYARPEYYFQYGNAAFNGVIAELDVTSDPQKRTALLQQAQRLLAEDQVNVFLFQLANPVVARTGIEGLWKDAPTQAVDLTGVSWTK
jgi:peptide/nickel transport system substrate-binding protein